MFKSLVERLRNDKPKGPSPNEIKREEERREFNNLLSIAKKILASDSPNKIYEYIYTLGKAKQHQLIVNCFRKHMISKEEVWNEENLFFLRKKRSLLFRRFDVSGNNLLNLTSVREDIRIAEKRLNPKDTLIFPLTWNGKRMLDNLLKIGKRVDHPWSFDKLNHNILYIKPINIGVVENGNHSMAVNIINNESSDVRVDEILDLSIIYEDIYTDGIHFRKKETDTIIDEVDNLEMAAIFEIGRLIQENGLYYGT
ncbi:hypothetical protein GLW08_21305 [Pontibacillus yanchengensis]|uniref:Uncharacterized protein n=3 Tax=Pontibacillus yanchengensis TaxID=462910 RepID=A0ACC7VLH6_9BACI|nr:DUF6710 family protein [Pontibacillus yanchengensis]MYL35422.1 hypothetical protein [Pontibacillus yanchengensis]MYL55841.1 hypothetical protein [Pontibacillus yanchengensis]